MDKERVITVKVSINAVKQMSLFVAEQTLDAVMDNNDDVDGGLVCLVLLNLDLVMAVMRVAMFKDIDDDEGVEVTVKVSLASLKTFTDLLVEKALSGEVETITKLTRLNLDLLQAFYEAIDKIKEEEVE